MFVTFITIILFFRWHFLKLDPYRDTRAYILDPCIQEFYCSFLKQLSSVFIKTILIAKVEWKCSKRKFFPLLSNFFFLRVPLMKKFCKTPFFSLFSKRRIKSVFHADLSTLKFFPQNPTFCQNWCLVDSWSLLGLC